MSERSEITSLAAGDDEGALRFEVRETRCGAEEVQTSNENHISTIRFFFLKE